MKKIYIAIIMTICAFTVSIAQEISVRKEKPYTYNITYTEVWVVDSIKGDNLNKNINLQLELDKKAIDEVSKIIVTLDSLKEEDNVTGRSVHYNFTDRLLGWDAAINNRLKDATSADKEAVINEAKLNDKVTINTESNRVEIDFGQISQESKNHILTIELEYKDGSISPPLSLGKKNLIKKEEKLLPNSEQKQ